MTRHDYQDMSTGYSPLRLATPSGTGEAVQPCVNCGAPVTQTTDMWRHWLHADGNRHCDYWTDEAS